MAVAVAAAAVSQMIFGQLLWDLHACAAAVVAFHDVRSVAPTLIVVAAAAAAVARVSAAPATAAAAFVRAAAAVACAAVALERAAAAAIGQTAVAELALAAAAALGRAVAISGVHCSHPSYTASDVSSTVIASRRP